MSHKPPLIPPSAATHTATPHENDVLCGRGGTINAHPGNEQYRHFVDRKKRVYLTVRFLICFEFCVGMFVDKRNN